MIPVHRTRRTKPSEPWSWTGAFAMVDEILSRPPAKPWIERVPGRGTCVARFVLPLELCQPSNRTRHTIAWLHGKRKRALRHMMAVQHYAQGNGSRGFTPLAGRPLIRAVRFSSVPPDSCANGAKDAIDVLTVKHNGLGYLRDDGQRYCDQRHWWEPAPKGRGAVLVEVWTG